MARAYTLKRRAEQQAETRQRIVDATVELHGSVGPARTTVSMIAERAGVQRHTYYAHFPEERDLFLACSGRALELYPLPDGEAWRALNDPGERLRVGLSAIYDWYARNATFAACILRDAQDHDLTREMVALRFGPPMAIYHSVLGEGLDTDQQALLHLAIGFFTWRSLATESGLPGEDAALLMARAVLGARMGAA